MAVTEFEAKITVAKFIQLAYDTNEDATLSIIHSSGSYSIMVDENGEGMLSSGSNIVTFDADGALTGLGFKVRRASITFSNGSGGTFNYTGTFRFAVGSQLSIGGSIDIYELIKSCSGLLCKAARFLDGRDAQIEQELQQYVR